MSKIDDLRARPGFDEEIQTVARAVAVALAGARPSALNAQGSIDIEMMLGGLMVVAAGMIAGDPNLNTPRDVRLQAESFGAMLRDMAKADRAARDADEPQFLDLIGAGLATGKGAAALN